MTTLEKITGLDQNKIEMLLEIGVIRHTAVRNFMMYDYFKWQSSKYGVMQAITNSAKKFNIDEDWAKKNIYRIKKIDV